MGKIIESLIPAPPDKGPPLPAILQLPWPKPITAIDRAVDKYADGVARAIQRNFIMLGKPPPLPSEIKKLIARQVENYRWGLLRGMP